MKLTKTDRHVVYDKKLNRQCSGVVFCAVVIDSHCLTQRDNFTYICPILYYL
jgi:hypothetical protein